MDGAIADQVIAVSKAEALKAGFAVCVAVLDAAAHMVAFARMDGANIGPIDVSIKKARTAALFQTDSLQFGVNAQPGAKVYTLEHTNGGLIGFGGGVVLRDKAGVVLGAVGISGATADVDEIIAQAAAAAVRA